MSRYHKPDISDRVPADLLRPNLDDQLHEVPDEEFTGVFSSDDEIDLLQETDHPEHLYLKNLLLFYLKLESKFLVPASPIQHIVEQFEDVHSLGQVLLCRKLLSSLTNDLDIPEDRAKALIDELRSSDLLLACSKGPLRSNYIRKSNYKKLFSYVEPVSIKLGTNDSNKECFFEYIPIKDSLEHLFLNKSVSSEYQITRYPNYLGYPRCCTKQGTFILQDITDGLAFQNNPFFQENHNALKIALYQDAFEVCNPLGSSKKKHKIIAVYLTLLNFRPHLRSNIDQILLAHLCKEKDFKYFGKNQIFKPLIDDTKELELHGINVGEESYPVKGTVCIIAGDNLGSHGIGGFVENFSRAKYWCRWCLLTSDQFHQNPCSVGQERTK